MSPAESADRIEHWTAVILDRQARHPALDLGPGRIEGAAGCIASLERRFARTRIFRGRPVFTRAELPENVQTRLGWARQGYYASQLARPLGWLELVPGERELAPFEALQDVWDGNWRRVTEGTGPQVVEIFERRCVKPYIRPPAWLAEFDPPPPRGARGAGTWAARREREREEDRQARASADQLGALLAELPRPRSLGRAA
jgi:hypothetical protein